MERWFFAYGSLRVGRSGHALIAPYVIEWQPADISGYDMVLLPAGHPGLVEHPDGRVAGELFRLHSLEAALAVLDEYEGEDYRRVLRPVRARDGHAREAWCYVVADPAFAHVYPRIAGGDFMSWTPEADTRTDDRGRFSAWYPVAHAHAHAPATPGVFQIRQARGLCTYPRGKSAMLYYGHAADLAAAIAAWRAREPGAPGEHWCRHQRCDHAAAALALYRDVLARFHTRFGALPRLHRDPGEMA